MEHSQGAKYYKARMALGKMFSFRSAESWFASFDKFVQGKKSRVVTVPSGTKKYGGERLSIDVVLPLKKVVFEDTEIYVFNNYDWYLSNLYGDYMKLPPVEQQVPHCDAACRVPME
jgi:lipopolysaccharide cholinephosphotransferase